MNFLYNANINNKIKDLSEIKEYENNEDYINLFVYEENTKYNYYKIGDLVFVHHYKYNNGNKGCKDRFSIFIKYSSHDINLFSQRIKKSLISNFVIKISMTIMLQVAANTLKPSSLNNLRIITSYRRWTKHPHNLWSSKLTCYLSYL